MNEEEKTDSVQYLVWDRAEVASVCTPAELEKMNTIMERILRKRAEEGKAELHGYLVVESTKEYAPEVAALINHYEGGK